MSVVKEWGRGVGYALGGIAALAVLTVVCTFLFGGASQLTAPFRGKTSEKNRTVGDGAFRVSSYERFFELCSSVQAKESKIKNISKELAKKDLTEVRRGQLEEAVLANQNQRSELIAQYNALTENKYRAAYLDKGLPADIDEGNPTTECK